MTQQKEITILGKVISVGNAHMEVSKLRFLPDNPRVYAATHGARNFGELSEEAQQDAIFEALCREPSVKNLKKDIFRHGGLIEPIFVRADTDQVIEGNSRLAVYRLLLRDGAEGEWDRIPCELVSSLSDEQQAVYLQQVHVTGKTQWSAYEKANFAYVRFREHGWSVERLVSLFGESRQTITRKIAVIEMMAENGDTERSRFSYYDVLFGLFSKRKRSLDGRPVQEPEKLRQDLLDRIRGFKADERQNAFTAMEMRKKVREIMKKPAIQRKFIARKLKLDEAYDLSKGARVEERLRKAVYALGEIERSEIEKLDRSRIGAFEQQVKKAQKAIDRLRKIADEVRAK